MKNTIIILFTLLACQAWAQQKQPAEQRRGDVIAGDSITILAPANGKEFQFVELYIKTRFAPSALPWDSVSGDGFYDSYFTGGDFDVKPLPNEYSGKKLRVISIKQFKDTEGAMVTVFFCHALYPNHLVWVMVEKAAINNEIQLHLRR